MSESITKRAEVVERLLEYAGDNGYSHIDYADTMRNAAALLQSTPDARPVPAKEARWVHISEDGEGQENYCEACGAAPGSACSDDNGREWGRRVHAIRQEEPDARPVRELTDEQIDRAIAAWFDQNIKGVNNRMRAALAASRTQPERAPLPASDHRRLPSCP